MGKSSKIILMTSLPFLPGSHLAACIRDSGHEDQELSAMHQLRAIEKWCAENGYLLTRKFIDSRSGKFADKRLEFQAMMTYFRQPQVPEVGVVVWSFSRFARNALEAQYYRSELKQRGKILHSLTETVPTGPEAIIVEAAYDFAHQKYLDDLSENVAIGLRDLVAIHGCVPGYPPKGFKRSAPIVTGHHKDGKPRTACRWEPNPELIPFVRQAFEMRATGATMGKIHAATHLFGNMNCYHGFFRNRLYIGILEYADLVVENYCPPVIDRPLWDSVQAVNARFSGRYHFAGEPRNHPRRLAGSYLLSSLVYCLRCGAPLAGNTSTIKGRAYVSYRCTNAKNRRSCDARMIPAEPLESEILHHLQDYVLQPDVLAAMLTEGTAAARVRRGSLQPVITGKRRQLQKIDAGISNLTRAIAESGHSIALLEELDRQETAKTELLTELANLEQQTIQADLPDLTIDQVSQLSTTISEKMKTGDVEVRRRILQGLINKIAVERDDHDIHGVIEVFAPIPQLGSSNIVATLSAPGGNLIYSHKFTTPRKSRKRPA
jgi:DNA invertase Pin-like site-specific DNA recombinase